LSTPTDDLGTREPGAGAGVAGVDDDLRVVYDRSVIDAVVVGRDQDRIARCNRPRRQRDRAPAGEVRVLAGRRHHLDERVVVVDPSTTRLDQRDQLQRGALAHVVDVFLEGDADKENR